MNKQKNSKNQQGMSQAQSSVTSSTNANGVANATSVKGQEQSLNAKQQASKAEYGTLTAKEDANNDYE